MHIRLLAYRSDSEAFGCLTILPQVEITGWLSWVLSQVRIPKLRARIVGLPVVVGVLHPDRHMGHLGRRLFFA